MRIFEWFNISKKKILFRDYAGYWRPCSVEQRLLKLGAEFLFGGNLFASHVYNLEDNYNALEEFRESRGAYIACMKAFDLYEGAKACSMSYPKLRDVAQIYQDFISLYIISYIKPVLDMRHLSLTVHEATQLDDLQDVCKTLIKDYGSGERYDEALRLDIFNHAYNLERFIERNFSTEISSKIYPVVSTSTPAPA